MIAATGVPASATSVNFSFGTQTINGNVINGLSSNASASAIATYMNSVLTAAGCVGCSVTVSGGVADQTYNGDGHVTGPGSGSSAGKKSLTLGTSEHATASSTTSTLDSSYDTFIANTSDGSTQISQEITLQFKNITGLTINSFDYEVFPDGSCTSLSSSNCGGALRNGHYPDQPDLIFEAGNNTNGTDSTVATFWGVTPGTTDGNSTHSPSSGTSGTERAPQAIGAWSGSVTNVSELDFVDWPATIGVDNLNISFTPSSPTPVPEPASLILFGTVVSGILLAKKRKRA
jgi:hypothetical protein